MQVLRTTSDVHPLHVLITRVWEKVLWEYQLEQAWVEMCNLSRPAEMFLSLLLQMTLLTDNHTASCISCTAHRSQISSTKEVSDYSDINNDLSLRIQQQNHPTENLEIRWKKRNSSEYRTSWSDTFRSFQYNLRLYCFLFYSIRTNSTILTNLVS